MKDYVVNSKLIDEWNWDKNSAIGIYPDKITLGSGKKVWWTCKNGHEYQMPVYRRKENCNNCPYCLGKKILVGFNDLATVNPMLASEWNYQKNGELRPTMVTGVCGKNVWWVCKHGHEWEAKISNRANGNGCPYCSGYYVLSGVNDLATTRPDLVEEWNYDKNKNLLPTNVARGYGGKVWWKCKTCGHEWMAAPNSRDNMGSGCPECTKGNRVSIRETKMYFYILKYFSDAISSFSNKTIGITELDIYIPSINVGVEYDGAHWHTDPIHDKSKDVACKQNNIHLVRIRESGCPMYESDCSFVYLKDKSEKTFENMCAYVLKILNIEEPDVNFTRDQCEIKRFVNYVLHK